MHTQNKKNATLKTRQRLNANEMNTNQIITSPCVCMSLGLEFVHLDMYRWFFFTSDIHIYPLQQAKTSLRKKKSKISFKNCIASIHSHYGIFLFHAHRLLLVGLFVCFVFLFSVYVHFIQSYFHIFYWVFKKLNRTKRIYTTKKSKLLYELCAVAASFHTLWNSFFSFLFSLQVSHTHYNGQNRHTHMHITRAIRKFFLVLLSSSWFFFA